MAKTELEEGQQYQHIRYGRVTLVHVGDSIVAYDVHDADTEPRYEFRGTFERDADLVDEEIVTDGGIVSGGAETPTCGEFECVAYLHCECIPPIEFEMRGDTAHCTECGERWASNVCDYHRSFYTTGENDGGPS